MSDSARPQATSWLEIDVNSDFSLCNIPFGVFSLGPGLRPRCGTALGSYAVDLSVLADAGLFDTCTDLLSPSHVFGQENLNGFISHSRNAWVQVRNRIIELFAEDGVEDLRANQALQNAALHKLSDVTLNLPVVIGDYTDFYSSREHATNVGTMFRGKDNALQPNWLHLPVGYHGRASTVFLSGTPIRRPCGQLQKDPTDPSLGSTFGPCKLMDFELEMAFFVGGPPNPPGHRLSVTEAYDRIFGFVLMNDWSARDIQKWEYVPLGPFTAKNFGTSISPWIVTTMALEEFKCETSAKEQINPVPLEYLRDPSYGSYNISLEVDIRGETMTRPETVSRSNFANLYWNAAQQLVHHSVTGCTMQPGDLLASGTISGSDPAAFGSMLELSWKGSRTVQLGTTGEERKFLKDGDTVVMRGWCSKDGHGRVGFGECSGKVLPPLLLGEEADGQAVGQPDTFPDRGRYQDFKLFSFWKSSASWRVRIALAAKKIPYQNIPVNIATGEQASALHKERNPMGQVPVLECIDTITKQTIRLTQSLAIIDFLDEVIPGARLLPADPVDRAVAREAAELINAGTQPLQNMPLLRQIEKMSEGKIVGVEFGARAIQKGLLAMEHIAMSRHNEELNNIGPFAIGGFAPTIADICIVPQLYNARLMGVDVQAVCPTLLKIEKACATHPWFVPAHPDVQPDAPTHDK